MTYLGYFEKSRWASKVPLLLMRTHGRCIYCGEVLKFSGNYKRGEPLLTIDHVVPRSKGGSNDIENLVPSCNRCNSNKSDLNSEDFIIILTYSDVEFNQFLQKRFHERSKKSKKFLSIKKPSQKKSDWEVNIKKIRRLRKLNQEHIDKFQI